MEKLTNEALVTSTLRALRREARLLQFFSYVGALICMGHNVVKQCCVNIPGLVWNRVDVAITIASTL